MGGLETFRNRSNTTFLRIGMGKDDKGRPRAVLGRRAKEGEPGAVRVFKAKGEPATDKDGNNVYRHEFGAITGRVIRIERKEVTFSGAPQQMLEIELVDDSGELFTIQLDRGDRYWSDLACRMNAIDWSKPVRLAPFSIARENDPDKRNNMLVAYQDGTKIEKVWNKDTPEGEGPPPAVYDADEKKWMWGKRNNWLDQNPIQTAINKVAFLNSTSIAGDPGIDEDVPPIDEQHEPPVTEDEIDPF